jgi:hypothetical protein
MLIPFDVNQNVVTEFNIPAHIIDWNRIKILKEVDDIRFTAMQEGNLDLTLDALKAIKFYKICLLANPVYNVTTGITTISNPVAWAYDISKEEILSAFDEFTKFFNPLKTSVLSTSLATVYSQMKLNTGLLVRLGTTVYNINGANAIPNMTTAPNKYAWFVPQTGFVNIGETKFNLPMYTGSAPTSGIVSVMDAYLAREMKVGSSTIIFDTSVVSPKLLDGPEVLANISIYVANNNDPEITSKRLMMSGAAFVDDVCVSCYEPNLYWGTAAKSYRMRAPSGGEYYLTVAITANKFLQWYKKKKATLKNGKIHYFPYAAISDPILGPAAIGNATASYAFVLQELQMFFDWNRSVYTFPPYFPRLISSGTLQVRNGYLYSDAANLYELEFQMFPDTLLDKLVTLINLQESIASLVLDIKAGTFKQYTAAPLDWYYTDVDGTKHTFMHPITLTPIAPIAYMNELIFESVTVWGESRIEIDAFLSPLKIANNYSYQKAYEAYLRGEATLLGSEALIQYEKKLMTGIFYMDNGFQYWRAFTKLELAVIDQMKLDSILSKQTADNNIITIAQNEEYQAQVNAQTIKLNEDKIAIAKIMAEAELKSIADTELSKIIVPTMEYLILRAELEGGVPSDALSRWVGENPNYYLNAASNKAVETLLNDLTYIEQRVATYLVADAVGAIEFTKALQELFTLK